MLTNADVARAVEQATRAPSVHNTQPWRWRIGPHSVDLHADWDRHLPATDPDRRDLVLSCGVALHHLRVALAATGLHTEIDRFPDPEDCGHLATVEFQPDREIDVAALGCIRPSRSDEPIGDGSADAPSRASTSKPWSPPPEVPAHSC
jgi:hypothetical protein